jgi:phosphate starvation-inducible PhoH-like protein
VHATHILKGIDGISIIQLDNSDVIRHKLVTKIIRAYDRANQAEDEPSAASPLETNPNNIEQ